MKKLKAVFLIDSFLDYGGGELFLRDLLNNFQRIDICYCISVKKSKSFFDFPIKIHYLDEVNPSNLKADFLFFWGRVGDAPCLFKNIPIKIIIALSDFNVNWYLDTSRHATHAIALSESVKKAINFKNYCEVIHAGIDFNSYDTVESNHCIRSHFGFKKNDFVVGQFCRMAKFKNFEMTIDCLSEMSSKYKLLIIGDGPNRQEILNLCESKIHGRYAYLNYIDSKYLGYYYKCLNAFCLPSMGEGFARVQWESMYFEVPFIGTPVGGVPDVIEHCVSGFIVNSNKDIHQSIDLIEKGSNTSFNAKKIADSVGGIKVTIEKIEKFLFKISIL